MRHLRFTAFFVLAAFVCLLLSFAMMGDSVCMFDPSSLACAKAEASRAVHFQVYGVTTLVFAVLSLALHIVKSRFAGAALLALGIGPFLSLLLPIA